MSDTTIKPAGNGPASDKAGSRLLLGMGACYAMGTFTDNFYKQCAILLAAAAGLSGLQSTATVLFSLPFILFSAWAGALADRVAKKKIVVAVKALELAALLLGGAMLVAGNWTGMLTVMFLMGTQSTFFSPAINGSIPECFAPSRVPQANAFIKMASTAAILLGMAAAGFVLDLRPASQGGLLPDFGPETALGGDLYGRWMAAGTVVLVAALGLAAAFTLRGRVPVQAGTKAPFPWTGPIDSIRHAWACRKDRPLMLVLLADAWFYGIAAIAVISIANLAADLGYSKSAAGLLTAVLMIGVAVGSLVAGRFPASSWRFLLVPSAFGMACLLGLVGLTPRVPVWEGFDARHLWFGLCLFAAGVCGGLYLIPLESTIQVRPAADAKGRVIAVSNFLSFAAMALFGAAFSVISLLPPAATFLVYGLATFCFCYLFAAQRLHKVHAENLRESASSFLGFILRVLVWLRYRVTENGLDALAPEEVHTERGPGMLILPNHPALIDPVIIYSRLAGLRPRPLSDEGQMRGPVQHLAAKIIRAVTIPDMATAGRKGADGVRLGLDRITEALKNGDNVLLYPSGQVYRFSREVLGGKAAVAHILAAVPEARVVLVRTRGLWGSGFSYACGNKPKMMPQLLRGIVTVLANLLLFTPRRDVHIDYAEPADLPRGGDKAELNRYLEAWYNEAETPPVLVRRFFWQRRSSLVCAPDESAGSAQASPASGQFGTAADVPDEVREQVYAILRRKAWLPPDAPLAPGQQLASELYIDSLALMETALELEETFGFAISSPELLVTVNDCLLATVGRLQDAMLEHARPAPRAWFAAERAAGADEPLAVAPGSVNILDAFLRLARKAPSRPLTAERAGIRSRRAMLTGVLALSRRFAALPGDRLGIMLPSVPAALAVWLAAMHAGKEPVFINWTVGRRNLEHCLKLSGVRHTITATALLEQLERTGNSVTDLPVEWIAADTLAASLRKGEKLRAAVLAVLHCLPLPFSVSASRVPERAAILFTSGSESLPKAVPLSHANIMANAADVLTVLSVRKGDRLLAMLPPFHSFGLLAGLALPACAGFAAAYHANPTESAALSSLVRDYRLTLLGATPTFLEAMLARAGDKAPLATLRYAFVGAEKCPERVYEAFARICPGASLCEGYGITECSPVVAVNRPGDTLSGSIGHLMPSMEAALVLEENGVITRNAQIGETGMLLVRGPNVFSGYLSTPDDPAPDPFAEFDGRRWYRTGDLVSMDAAGRLFFKGRLKRFVKLGGEMISLPQMEDVLQRAFAGHPAIPEDGAPYIAVEARRGSEDEGQAELVAFTTLPLTTREVNTALRDSGLSSLCSIRRVLIMGSLPLLGAGKIDYRTLAEQA